MKKFFIKDSITIYLLILFIIIVSIWSYIICKHAENALLVFDILNFFDEKKVIDLIKALDCVDNNIYYQQIAPTTIHHLTSNLTFN